jgi:hypothetical protein
MGSRLYDWDFVTDYRQRKYRRPRPASSGLVLALFLVNMVAWSRVVFLLGN